MSYSFFNDYEYQRNEIIKETFIDLKRLRYWEKVKKMFNKKQKEEVEKFSYEFKHNGLFSDVDYDNECKIESYAKEYGFEIIDEDLRSTKSIYTFQRISN